MKARDVRGGFDPGPVNRRPSVHPHESMKRLTVLLAEDHVVVREGLKSLLEAEGDLEVIGEASTGRQVVELARRLQPAVVVMDIAMPEINGLEATRQIRKDNPGARVLVLSAHGDEGYVEQAMSLGAAGYLLKQTSAHVLCKAVREVANGCPFFGPSVARSPGDAREPASAPGRTGNRGRARLSSRESAVLQLVAEGRGNKQVAAELGISVKTVEKHRQRVMERLNIHDTAGLTRYAIASGVVENRFPVTTPSRRPAPAPRRQNPAVGPAEPPRRGRSGVKGRAPKSVPPLPLTGGATTLPRPRKAFRDLA